MSDNTENFLQIWKRLRSYKKIFKVIDVVGNIAMLIALIMKRWFIAFLLYVMFFPDEVQIIKFFKSKKKK